MKFCMLLLILYLPSFCSSQSNSDFKNILITTIKQKQDTGIYHYSKRVLSLYGTEVILPDTLTGFDSNGKKQFLILSVEEYESLKLKFYSQSKAEWPTNLIDNSFRSEYGGTSSGNNLIFAISEPLFIRNNSICIFLLFPSQKGCGCISLIVYKNWEEYFNKIFGCF